MTESAPHRESEPTEWSTETVERPECGWLLLGRQDIRRGVVEKEFLGCAAFSVLAQLTDQYGRSVAGLQGLGAASPPGVTAPFQDNHSGAALPQEVTA